MKEKYVKDLRVGDTLSNINFSVIKAEKKVAKNGKEYMDVTLGDRSGSILGRIWSEKFSACCADVLKEGMVVASTAQVTEYQGKLQLVVTMLVPIDTYDDEDFIPVSKLDIDEMFDKLVVYINSIEDLHLKGLFKNILADTDFVEKFKKTPAAMKMHHDFKGGLLEHILEVIAFALPMVELYQPANRDLVIAGVIMHDIGKVEEIIWKNLAIEYSTKGKLIGHINIGIEILDKYKPTNFDPECYQLLKHIIFSHHGKLEFGAPVVPATIEAKIVSLSDDASAKLRGYKSLLDSGIERNNGNDFSEYSRAIETMVYLKEYQSSKQSIQNSQEPLF